MWGHTDPAFLLFNFQGSPRSPLDRGPRIWGCSSAGRAPALQAGGQGFESLHLHHLANVKEMGRLGRTETDMGS